VIGPVGQARRHRRGALEPAAARANGAQAQGLVRPAVVVGQPQQVQPALDERGAVGGRAAAAHQRGEARAQRGVKPLDVGRVDGGPAMASGESGGDRCLRPDGDAPNGPRLIVMVPSVYLIASLFVARAARYFQLNLGVRARWLLATAMVGAAFVLLANGQMYFDDYARKSANLAPIVVAREMLKHPSQDAYLLGEPNLFVEHGVIRFVARGVRAHNLKNLADLPAPSDDGVLLIIAKDDRTLRMEVGYGLESVLNDGKVGALIEASLVSSNAASAFALRPEMLQPAAARPDAGCSSLIRIIQRRGPACVTHSPISVPAALRLWAIWTRFISPGTIWPKILSAGAGRVWAPCVMRKV